MSTKNNTFLVRQIHQTFLLRIYNRFFLHFQFLLLKGLDDFTILLPINSQKTLHPKVS
jgi:hypothetical protein